MVAVVGEEMIMMHMWFYQSAEAVFLFKQFETASVGTYTIGLIITFLLAVLLEAISYALLWVKVGMRNVSISKVTGNILMVLLYFVQLLLAFALMLLVMTFNGLIFFAVVLGIVAGYAIFGFMKLNLQATIGDSGYCLVAEKCCT